MRHAEVCAFLTASIDGGTLPDPLCANLDVHLDDWSQLAYAKMRQQLIASGNFRVDFQTVRESHGQLLAHPRLFCIHLQNSRVDPRAILEC